MARGYQGRAFVGTAIPEITDLLHARPELADAFPLAESLAAGVRMNT